MDRKQKVQLLQAITAGQLTIQQAITAINNANAQFVMLVGMDLAEHESGHKIKDIVIVDGVPGKMRIVGNEIEAEIYL